MLYIPEKKQLNQLNVLIIDEQSYAHDVIKASLKDLGIEQVKSAQNAFFALRLCEVMHFDMVLIAFDVKSDKDGFNLLEEMKFKGLINSNTIVIFLSSDTSPTLVNCVIELQPNDFWVKPLDKSKVAKRIQHIVEFYQRLYKLHYCFDQQKYTTAIYLAQRHIADEELKTYHPQINRLMGRSLFLIHEHAEAEQFYRGLIEQYNFAWVHIELTRNLFSLGKIQEAMAIIDSLVERDDARFSAYDLLAEHYLAKEDYVKAYEIMQQACKLAPRSIERNKKCWYLARLNHDRQGQYIATCNMARYAKNSIHDSPELTLNIIRSSLDLVSTLGEQESQSLLARVERDITALQTQRSQAELLSPQITIARARLYTARRDKKGAETLIKEHPSGIKSVSFEDKLDHMKILHELGEWQASMQLLEQIREDGLDTSFNGKVLAEFLAQETQERQDIRYSPKELGEMASAHYKGKRYIPALNLLNKARQLSPDNDKIALSILKVLANLAEQDGLDTAQKSLYDECCKQLNEAVLPEKHRAHLNHYVQRIDLARVV